MPTGIPYYNGCPNDNLITLECSNDNRVTTMKNEADRVKLNVVAVVVCDRKDVERIREKKMSNRQGGRWENQGEEEV